MTSPAVALVATLYGHAGTSNWDAVNALMAEDCVIHEAASLPFGGTYHGRDAMQRLFGIVMAYWIEPVVEVEAIVGDDRHVVSLLRFTMTSRHSGRRFSQTTTEVFVVEDGRVAELRVHYFDTAEIAAEAQPQSILS